MRQIGDIDRIRRKKIHLLETPAQGNMVAVSPYGAVVRAERSRDEAKEVESEIEVEERRQKWEMEETCYLK